MPIVSQGNSVVVDVGAHDGLWIKSTGNAEVTVNQVYAGTPEVINVTTDTVRVGFYGEPVTVSIRAVSGIADYQSQQFSIQPLTAVQDGDRTDSSPLDVKMAVNGLSNYAKLLSSGRQIRVMASPPTVTSSTTNSLSAGQRWAATNNASAPNQLFASSAYSIWGGGYWDTGAGFPDNQGIVARNITNGASFTSLVNKVAFIHTGTRFNIQVKGGASVLIKVNDEFTSLTPTTTPSDGNFYHVLVDFGATTDTRRVDVWLYNCRFGGVWTDLVSVIEPAQNRSIKTFFVGDSFSEGSGNELSPMWSWCNYLSEYLGLDDVTVSGLGATGFVAAPPPKVPFGQRIQRDVLDLMPAGETCLLWLSLSINDSSFTAAQVSAAINAVLDTVAASGKNPIVVLSSPTINKGIGDVPANQRQQNDAARDIASRRGCIWVDDVEQVTNLQFAQVNTTTTAAVSANATTVQTARALIPGCSYEFDDGTAFFVRSVSGTTATVDRISDAEPSGANVTMRGSCYLTGTGRVGSTAGWGICDTAVSSDGTHPTNQGHQLKAVVDSAIFRSIILPS